MITSYTNREVKRKFEWDARKWKFDPAVATQWRDRLDEWEAGKVLINFHSVIQNIVFNLPFSHSKTVVSI